MGKVKIAYVFLILFLLDNADLDDGFKLYISTSNKYEIPHDFVLNPVKGGAPLLLPT
jgi:hypothetical protein